MSFKYFSLSGEPAKTGTITPFVTMDRSVFPGCIYGEGSWLREGLSEGRLVSHASDELLVVMGSDPDNHECLNMEITFQLENDMLTLKNTCVLFIPAGAAHGIIEVKNVAKPALMYSCHLSADIYEEKEAAPRAEPGTYAKNAIQKYERADGSLPEAPEGFLTLLLWIDGKKLSGAPYMEAVWFKTTNDTGPEEHEHDFDEFIGFFGGDPAKPGELSAVVEFYIEGQCVTFTKNCLIYIPRGVRHGPILVPELNKPIIHFSGGNGGDYVRRS